VSGQTTTYVYDAFGNLAAEYGGQSTGCGTCYVTTDHLGSTRLLTNSAGMVAGRYDYEPFGVEIGANYDGRTTAMSYTSPPDASNPKFTGQMRDFETADANGESFLDFFNARYYAGAQGRFQSPDPANAGADPSNPQSWNGYSYVANNPLSYTDPSGMFVEATAGGCAIGGPAGCAIGAAIDIGELLAGLFAGGIFGGPPPSIPSALATPSSPILQPSPDFDSQGWGQLPDSGDPDELDDPGTLFGSGNTSPYIFSAQPGSSTSPWALDPLGTTLKSVGSFSSGAADLFTLGGTKKINQWDGGAAFVNYNSGTYTAGRITGVGMIVTGAVAPIAADIGEVQAGRLFGTRFGGNRPLLNSNNNLRIGWSLSRRHGQYVFRIGGAWLGKFLSNPHINLWPPSWWGGPPNP